MATYITTLKDGNGNNLAPRTKVDAIDDFNTYHDNTKQNVTDNTLTTTNKTVPTAINEVNSIAKGANQAVGYSNYSAMITALNAMDDEEFSMGQNIYIVTVNVPDLWVSSVENISSTYIYTNDATVISDLETYGFIQAGYYKLSMLETQKVDLTNYVTNTNYATSSVGGVLKVSNGDYGLTVDSGVLKGTVRTYTQYNDMSSKGLVAKGTLENVITGKGLGTYSKPSGGIPKTDLASDIVETLNKADSIKTELEDSDNHFDVSAITFGYEVHSTDGISPESNSAISDYIPVTQGTVVYINNSPTYTSAVGKVKRIAEFNENKEFISQTNRIGVDESQYAYTVRNANTKYLVFGVYQRVTDNTVRENLDYSHIMVTFNVGYKPYKEYVKPGMTVNLEKPTKDKKMLIFGDSITETASMNDDGTNYVEGVRTNWMTFAKDMLETSNFKNYAQSGAMYKDFSGKEYYRQWVSNQIGIAISDSNNDDAEIIVLSLGTNDGSANDTYESAMLVANRTDLDRTKFYEAIRYAMWTLKDKYPDAKCFVATPIQRAAREQDVSLRTAIIKMGNRYNFKIIDAEFESGIIRDNEVYQGEGEDLYDGLHPNGKGAQKMAELYSSVILNSYLFE